MASSNSSQMQNSGSEGDLQQVMMVDERKRKRMESNRESARRSRAKKQKHLDDLTVQIAQLKRENQQVLHTINLTTQQFLSVDAENSVLRAQMSELTQRLESLNVIINYLNALGGPAQFKDVSVGILGKDMGNLGILNGYNTHNLVGVNEPWNDVGGYGYGYLNQPIMASADLPQY